MPIVDGRYEARISTTFRSVKEGKREIKSRIAASRKVRISNIPMRLLEELMPLVEGKDVRVILPIGEAPTEALKKLGKVAVTKARIYKDYKGMEANVALYYDNAMVMSAASDMDGAFSFDKLEPATYVLTASAAEYQEYRTDVIVKAGEETPVRIALMPVVTEGTLTLNIMDLETREPMTADVTIGDMAVETVTETVEKILTAGTYTIFAEAPEEHYLPYNRTVTLEAGETREIDVGFVKKEFKIVLPEVYFETAKSELKPESHAILDDAAATLKDVCAANPDIKIEIQGHTDSQGSDAYNMNLSNERAATVKNYLVDKHGIKDARLITKGYGESKPVATNNTAAGRAQNRRVEFLVIE